VTVITNVEEAPGLRVPEFEHVTSRFAGVHDQPVPVPDTKVNPSGSVSVTTMDPVVAASPLLATVTVYEPLNPISQLPVWELVIARSGNGGTTSNVMFPLVPRLVVTLRFRAPVAAFESTAIVAMA
jgi:hypothetical protein